MPAGSTPFPPIKVQIGFASNPLDVPQVFTDITNLVRRIKIDRGRQHVLNKFEPGRLTLTVNGRGRELDPFNTASPYYTNLKINKQIQVLVYWAAAWHPLYTGFIDAYTPLWLDNLNTDLEITATDGLRILQAQWIDGLTPVGSASATLAGTGVGGAPFGVPPGGTIGQVLTKLSSQNFAADWEAIGGAGGVSFLGFDALAGFVTLSNPATTAFAPTLFSFSPGTSHYVLVGMDVDLSWTRAPVPNLYNVGMSLLYSGATLVGSANLLALAGEAETSGEATTKVIVLFIPTGGAIDLGIFLSCSGGTTWTATARILEIWEIGF
jgi:hypothetical protein